MEPFRNILVAIDIDVNGEIAAGCRAAVAQALWLAQRNRARLAFVHVSDMSDEVRGVVDMQPQSPLTAQLARSRRLLETLAAAVPDGAGNARMLFGTVWHELAREVSRQEHDLVVVGTKGRGAAGRALFGSTASHLLRGCPCPVWAVSPRQQTGFSRILVAHDLRSAGDSALSLAASLARQQEAELHVLHVMEHIKPDRAEEADVQTAMSLVEQRLLEQCRLLGMAGHAHVTVALGSAHDAILDHVTVQAIDLVCMGMLARAGLERLVAGNTAEQVLPVLGCSLLAIRPDLRRAAQEMAS